MPLRLRGSKLHTLVVKHCLLSLLSSGKIIIFFFFASSVSLSFTVRSEYIFKRLRCTVPALTSKRYNPVAGEKSISRPATALLFIDDNSHIMNAYVDNRCNTGCIQACNHIYHIPIRGREGELHMFQPRLLAKYEPQIDCFLKRITF